MDEEKSNVNVEHQTTKVKKSTIYTKTGDQGTTSLFSGDRRPKSDPIFGVLGTIDELNASLGVAKQYCEEKHPVLFEHITSIQ